MVFREPIQQSLAWKENQSLLIPSVYACLTFVWIACILNQQNYENMNIGYNYKECIGLKVKPRQGDALLFYSMLPNGTFDKVCTLFLQIRFLSSITTLLVRYGWLQGYDHTSLCLHSFLSCLFWFGQNWHNSYL